jgi:hypothetical protein
MLLVRKAISANHYRSVISANKYEKATSVNELTHFKGFLHSCRTQSNISANMFENVTPVQMN